MRGTTSACAENTQPEYRRWRPRRNYLRVRGEYPSWPPHPSTAVELPPRTRRIRLHHTGCYLHAGTTSAHAENTPVPDTLNSRLWNYLRARGEYSMISCFSSGTKELPPRTRRIHRAAPERPGSGGTTSAHAENTRNRVRPGRYPRNYLRARGEYPK